MSKNTVVQLGDRVRDMITGLQGIAVGVTYHLYGCTRFVVQPEKFEKDGKPAEELVVDEPQLIVVKKGLFDVTPNIPMAERVELNSRVKDKVTGLAGVTIGVTYWLKHGHRRFIIQPEDLTNGKIAAAFALDEPMIEIVKTDILKNAPHVILPDDPVAAKAVEEAKKPQKNHGPREDFGRAPDVLSRL